MLNTIFSIITLEKGVYLEVNSSSIFYLFNTDLTQFKG